MSIEKVTKLEDLKEEANDLYTARYQVIGPQKRDAIEKVLLEIKNYLSAHDFEITPKQHRDFSATYKGTTLEVSSNRDDESAIMGDYGILISSGKQNLTAFIEVTRGTRINGPVSYGTIDEILSDYEYRYIPALKALSKDELNGKYVISTLNPENKAPKMIKLEGGKEIIDHFFMNH